MAFLWDQPYFFLILCLGLSFWLRSMGVFAEARHKHGFAVFFQEQCTPGQRRALLLDLLRSVPGGGAAFHWLLLFSMLRAGGAGCLAWYLVCSLLLLRPLGALTALWRYYQGPEGDAPDLSRLLAGLLRRQGARPRPLLGRALGLLQLLFLCGVLPFLAAPALGFGGCLPPETLAAAAPAGLAAAAVCLLARGRGRLAASALFLLFLGAALAGNVFNLIPVLKLALLDSVQAGDFLFALSGAGLMAALRGGVWAGTADALLQSLAGGRDLPPLPHPVFYSVQAQARASLQLVLQLAVGLLFLCAQLVPQDNGWVLWGLSAFLFLFAALDLVRAVRALLRRPRRGRLAAAALMCALPLWDAWTGQAVFPAVFGVVCWLCALAAAGLLLAGGNWYFVLLENYRDAWIWHVHPHPFLRPYDRGS